MTDTQHPDPGTSPDPGPAASDADGAVAGGARPSVLFACVHNGGRSLAAKVLTEHYAAGAVEVRSAGSQPGEELNPVVVQVLHERGLSTEGERPQLLTREGVEQADLVVTMGCGEQCPFVPGTRYEDWELTDPKGKDLATVRAVVDEIDERVRALVAELTGTLGTP